MLRRLSGFFKWALTVKVFLLLHFTLKKKIRKYINNDWTKYILSMHAQLRKYTEVKLFFKKRLCEQVGHFDRFWSQTEFFNL